MAMTIAGGRDGSQTARVAVAYAQRRAVPAER